jgi:methylthioribulose-1-phosphate dehydratase
MMRVERKYRFDASGQIPLSLFEQIKLGQLCDVAVRLDRRLAIPATSSNFSLRKDSTTFLISRSGKHKRELNAGDFLVVDLQGKAQAPVAPKPSDETLLHALIYRKCPWISTIIHCHAPELEALHPPAADIDGHELLKALGAADHHTPFTLNVFANNQDMAALAGEIENRQFKQSKESKRPADAVKGPVLFVLSQHGIYCGGETIGKAEAYLEALLHLLKLAQDKPEQLATKRMREDS